MPSVDWRVGSKLVHPFDPELGVGLVRAIEDRYLEVYFPAVDRTLTFAAEAGLARLVLEPGQRATLIESDEEVRIESALEHSYRLADGRTVADAELWPSVVPDSPAAHLASLRVDPLASFQNRIDGLEVMNLREAGGLGSFLGGRIELFPHQLYTALQAVERDPVRWLLADEVGLGKTIEASLILSALVRTGRSQKAIVIAPETLTVQWLGELYRKFHQVFSLLDDERLAGVAVEFGDDFNPFDAKRTAIVSLERLVADRKLLEQAIDCEPDLVVVDEAHRLCNPEIGDLLGPLVRRARHALLATATPLQADRAGFYALLEMLHPDAFASYDEFSRAVDSGEARLPCTSSVRRADLGGLPPRVPEPVDLPAATADPRSDPRAAWIASHTREWRSRGEKALVFVHELSALNTLRSFLEKETGTNLAVFHENLPLDERDIALARFRLTDEPLLLCSEAGGEGRNFQFCDRMIHYDLPDDPIQLEQRIGRLDRIGRDKPVEIVYFRCADAQPDLARLYERLDIFSTPAAGIDAALGGVERAIEVARKGDGQLDIDALEAAVAEARSGTARDAPRVFYPDAYTPDMATDVLARVPADLDARMQRYCVAAAEELGLVVLPKPGVSRYYLELPLGFSGATMGGDGVGVERAFDFEGALGRVDSLPGVSIDELPGYGNQVRFLGTFDREEAIQTQSLAFFSNGQMLVEGLMLELEDGPRGRTAVLDLPDTGLVGSGLLCVYKNGAAWTPVVVDTRGTLRPEWAAPLLGGLPRAEGRRFDGDPPDGWAETIRALAQIAETAEAGGLLHAAAYFRFT